ncbi:MAG: hypothetical protein HC795_02590 [Coleofasciculaceae cyanobacterium RL_1_1]|nr:hypothetical protein [Coleofasciculaceae cyanobacterium RL_1_1]
MKPAIDRDRTHATFFLAKKTRYKQDPPNIQLGGIAANLARVQSFGRTCQKGETIEYLLRETRFFLDWAAPDVSLEIAIELRDLQRLITRWLFAWEHIWTDETERETVLQTAKDWSDRLLQRSGLI